MTQDIDESEAYCIRESCYQLATHWVSHYDIESGQLIQTIAACKHDVPMFLMGHNDMVYARFTTIEVA